MEDEVSEEGVGSGVGDCRHVMLNGSLCGSGDMSMLSPGDEERMGGVVSVGLPLEPVKRVFRVAKRDLLGVGRQGLGMSVRYLGRTTRNEVKSTSYQCESSGKDPQPNWLLARSLSLASL